MLGHLLHLLLLDIMQEAEKIDTNTLTNSQLQRLAYVIAMDTDLTKNFFTWINKKYIKQAVCKCNSQLYEAYVSIVGKAIAQHNFNAVPGPDEVRGFFKAVYDNDYSCNVWSKKPIHSQQLGILEVLMRESLIEMFKKSGQLVDMTSDVSDAPKHILDIKQLLTQHQKNITQIMAPEYANELWSILLKKLLGFHPLTYWFGGVAKFLHYCNISQRQRLLLALIDSEIVNDIAHLIQYRDNVQSEAQQKQIHIKSLQD